MDNIIEVDKDFVKEVLTEPNIRKAIREGNFDEAFKLCGNSVKIKTQLALALHQSGVKFLNGMTEIPENLFRYCNIDSITIPGNIKKIVDMAFFGSQLANLVIEEGVEEVGSAAFSQTKVRDAWLPSSIKLLDDMSFGRANIYVDKDSVESLKDILKEKDEYGHASTTVGNRIYFRPTVGKIINKNNNEVLVDRGTN